MCTDVTLMTETGLSSCTCIHTFLWPSGDNFPLQVAVHYQTLQAGFPRDSSKGAFGLIVMLTGQSKHD